MPDATHDPLRLQIERAIYESPGLISTNVQGAADRIERLFAVRERVLRERIEGLPTAHYPGIGTVVELADVRAALNA